MKLHEIQLSYQLDKSAFFQWLFDTKMIKPSATGYVVGERALKGMETLYTGHHNSRTGRVETTSQVIVADEEVDYLVSLYLKSGEPLLESKVESKVNIIEPMVSPDKKVIEDLQDRVAILENQIEILNLQLKRWLKNS